MFLVGFWPVEEKWDRLRKVSDLRYDLANGLFKIF